MFGPILNQQYGLTELLSTHPSMAVTHLSPRWHSEKIASCGRPLIGTVIRVVDDHGAAVRPGEVGEIVVRAHEAGGGYWKQPDGELGAFQKGWIHTGDVGWADEDGFLYIKDRKNDMIITGGLNVYPAEVESVLHEHPSVSQCAVVGVPDSKWIEVPWDGGREESWTFRQRGRADRVCSVAARALQGPEGGGVQRRVAGQSDRQGVEAEP